MTRYSRLRSIVPAQAGGVAYLSVSLMAFLAVQIPRLNHALTGSWSFRFTQTAFTVRSFLRDGWNPFRVELPIFGPPWRVPMEFPIFQWLAAAVSRVLGLGEVAASRSVVLASFLASAVITYAIVRRLWGVFVAQLTLAFYLWSPFALDWGAQVLIDFTAVAILAGAALAALRAVDGGAARWWAIAWGLGALGALQKVTTAVSWILVWILGAVLLRLRGARTRGVAVAGAVSTFAPVALWTLWSDGVKRANSLTEFLTSTNLRDFNFGTWDQRLDPHAWGDPYVRFSEALVGGPVVGVIVVVVALAFSRSALLVGLTLVAALSAPIVFLNLYGHDYYPIAIYPFACILAGCAVGHLALRVWTGRPAHHVRMLAGVMTVSQLALAATSANGFERLTSLERPASRAETTEINAVVPAGEWLIVVGDDWSSTILYETDRRGVMYRERGGRVAPNALGRDYRWVYWHPVLPFAWEDYFPEGVGYVQESEHVYRIEVRGAA